MNNIPITPSTNYKYFDLTFLKYITGTPQTSFKRQYPARYTPYVRRYATKDYTLEHTEFNCGSEPIFHEVRYHNNNTNEFIITTLDDNWKAFDQEFFSILPTTRHRLYLPSVIETSSILFHKNGIDITSYYIECGEPQLGTPEWEAWELTFDLL